mgnify:CR=1 FL=1|tara:strand:- start:7112 stop:8974 length:1863 start_codon:yes stop_codon:yes gene_type:complete
MAGIGSFEPFGGAVKGYFKDLARGVFGGGEPGSRRFPRSPQLGPNPGLSGYYPSMGGSADKSYRGASFPSEEKDIAWALALNIAAQEGKDISDREVQREIFYETFPNAPLDGFKNFMMKVTDPEFEYNPENKDPARFRILDAAGNVIRDFGRGGKDRMANDSGRPVEGCGPGEVYNPVLDRCEVYGPPPPGRQPTDGELEDIDDARDRVFRLQAICNGTLDPDSLTDDEIEVLTKGTQTRAQLKDIGAWCPTEWLKKDDDKKDDSPPSDSPPRGDDSPPGGGTIPGGGTSPGGGGPAPGQEEPGRGGAGEPPLANGECIPPFVPITLPSEFGGGTYCGLPPNLPDSGQSPGEGGPTPGQETGGDDTPTDEDNQGEDDTDLPDTGPDTGGGDGDKDKGGTPEPDANGVCPAGYIGRDTNGDGINDICIPIGRGIRALVSLLGGSGGFPGGNESDLNKAAQRASASVFNDPLNFARIQPSALQMVDPRYYGISSFVPKGEEPDFNLGYQGVPGQMYANYNVDDKTGALSPKNARNGGIISLAEGGETNFPRKNGQIAGPGTERSDDIPAMLSDGEFVVNAKAVRGIGRLFNGKIKDKKNARREGARTMYALQRAGEKAAGLS